ncbi:hypothetical protein EDB81DRAFT_797489 [Dactylonectria macrodidyma]|uniref:Uncharacterized protein n=1 Tax=Dactylonectria macrodidyma TaxID=307937 RepID=A0A9P9J394_9HYPO|nr:hypothetical protein EDB81DRAFT_797489 [Dactylonectria macrodidyma]
MHVSELLLFTLAAVGPAACATKAKPDEPFQLYAYGENVGGLVLFSDGDQVYAGEHSLFPDAQTAPVIFTDNNGEWTCSPNITGLADNAQPTWSNLTFAIPSFPSSQHNVSLVNVTGSDTSDLVVSGFSFYGAVAFASDDGALVSRWQGIPSNVEGVYTLKWNETEEVKGGVIFTLTVTAPATA